MTSKTFGIRQILVITAVCALFMRPIILFVGWVWVELLNFLWWLAAGFSFFFVGTLNVIFGTGLPLCLDRSMDPQPGELLASMIGGVLAIGAWCIVFAALFYVARWAWEGRRPGESLDSPSD